MITDVSVKGISQVVDNRDLMFDLKQTSERIGSYLIHVADYTRDDRLWPAHFLVFVTNPLSLSYGACGPALFLKNAVGGVPDEVIAWILDRPIDLELYPPGLYVGLAGIGYAYQELGAHDQAAGVMEMMYRSPLLYEEPSMFLGVAGWGLVSLHFFLETRRQSYLEQAVKAGEHLVHIAQHEGTTSFWRSKYDGLVHFGYGFGASGIALFLMYLYKATKSSEFRTCAIRALDFDLAHRVEGESGWHWRRFENDTLLYPYWIHGSAGIGSTLIRFSHWLGIKRYEILAREIAEDTIVKYAFIPSLFEGLAGIGEFALDMFQFTGDESYRLKALDIADTILWFKINKPQGVAYPGRWLTRISCDYGTGSAGIGLFLKRLLVPGRRVAVDLDLEKLKHVPKTLRAHSVS